MILQVQSSKSYILQTYSFIPTASYGVLRKNKTPMKASKTDLTYFRPREFFTRNSPFMVIFFIALILFYKNQIRII